MGLGSYFKTGASGSKSEASKPATNAEIIPMSQSAKTSRPASLAPSEAMTNKSARTSRYYEDLRHEVMCSHIYQAQSMMMWVQNPFGGREGVVVKKGRDQIITAPPQLSDSSFAYAVAALNVPAALTINSPAIRTFLQIRPDTLEIPLPGGLRVQCLPDMIDLPRARKHQCAALIISEGLLVVWDDDPSRLIERAKLIEHEFVQLVWRSGGEDDESLDEKKGAHVMIDGMDEESIDQAPSKRPTKIQNSILVSLTLLLITVILGAGYREIAAELMVDHSYIRLALVLLTPLQIFFALFFCQVIVGCIAQCIGPIKQLKENSKYYSSIKSRRLTEDLPHVTIQCPVYKEGLHGVIAPTIRSIKAAISTYELQGGTANIFVNDDGLQLLEDEERQTRLDFYEDNNIGFVARPKHGEDGFLRRGKFKKASNMNYALMISCQVEDKLAAIERSAEWTTNKEAEAYVRCLSEVLEEHEGRAWADGNIRVGDYILLIDSDTRVPEDCLLDACSEMEQSPAVGIMQFSSGVMNVTDSFFENGITFFTNLIYSAIRFCVANGDVAPFVGHNAILRWSAIQQVSYVDEDNYEKFWSESHVSEDFDMSLRLQVAGYVIRLAAWAGDGFKEGVSLTVYDELARWEKYAYGCNELLWNPIRTWLWRGPFTPLFRKFLASNARFTYKISIISYIGRLCFWLDSDDLLTRCRNILCHRRFMDHDTGQLLCRRALLAKPRSLLHYELECVVQCSHCFYWFRQHCACCYALPHGRKAILRVAHRELQMDSDVCNLSWRALSTRQSSAALTHVRIQHAVGSDQQGTRAEQFLRRGATSDPPLQVQLLVLDCHYTFDDRHGDCELCSLGLQDHRFHRNLPTGHCRRQPLFAADCAQPCTNDIFILEKFRRL